MLSKLILTLFSFLFLAPAFAGFEAIADDRDQAIADYYEHAGHHEFIAGKAKKKLHYVEFKVPNEIGAIVFVSGYAEPVEKYAEVAYDLRDSGYSFYMLDHRGQGESDRIAKKTNVVHVDSYRYWLDDFAKFVKEKVRTSPTRQVFVIAHSMGGGIVTAAAIKYKNLITAASFSAPMYQPDLGKYSDLEAYALSSAKILIGQGTGYAQAPVPREPFNDQTPTTHSEKRYENMLKLYAEKPEIVVIGTSYGWVHEAIELRWFLKNNAKQLKTPILIFQAGDERIVKNEAQNYVCARAKACTMIHVKESRHEFLWEIDPIRNFFLSRTLDYFGTFAK